jgi:hypothetical protein
MAVRVEIRHISLLDALGALDRRELMKKRRESI